MTTAALLLVSVGALAACGSAGPQQHSSSDTAVTPSISTSTSAATSGAATPRASATTVAGPTTAQLQAQARTRLAAVMKQAHRGGVSVAAYDVTTKTTYEAGKTSGMWTASVYKLFVLEALLVENQGSGGLSASEKSQAIPMIEQSDNTAGYSLFEAAGGNAGLSSAWARLGLDDTTPGATDPTFTRTSAMQCLILLRNLIDKHSPLDSDSRSYALNLMRNVEADQRWGVGVVADKGTTFANKNGWLSIDDDNPAGERDDGLWAVNSVGVVTVKGHTLLLAVMTEHNPDFDSGVDYVQRLAEPLAATLRP